MFSHDKFELINLILSPKKEFKSALWIEILIFSKVVVLSWHQIRHLGKTKCGSKLVLNYEHFYLLLVDVGVLTIPASLFLLQKMEIIIFTVLPHQQSTFRKQISFFSKKFLLDRLFIFQRGIQILAMCQNNIEWYYVTACFIGDELMTYISSPAANFSVCTYYIHYVIANPRAATLCMSMLGHVHTKEEAKPPNHHSRTWR